MILTNCRLLSDFTGGISAAAGSVELENGRIVKVSSSLSADREAFDCEGGTLLPGLIDLHTHLTLLSGVGNGHEDEPMELLLDAQAVAGRYLDYGFTTIRDCGSLMRAAHYVRDAVKKGLIEGPDIISAGLEVTSSAVSKKTPLSRASIQFADGVDDVCRAVREEAAYLCDFIKIYASGSAFLPTGIPEHPIMTYEEIRSAVETARMNGIYVAAHCHADEAIRACIQAGVRTIEHATYLGEETLELLLSTPSCCLIPTFSAMYVSQTEPEEREFWLERLNPMLERCTVAIEKAYRAGAKIGFGSDSSALSVQYEKGIEFKMRKELCHMKDMDILMQATGINAEIAGIDDHVGQIREGLNADLILVNGRPDENIEFMYGKPAHVWKSGRMVR